jgi:hypothetical protein
MDPSVWHDKGLQRTNPVYVLEQIARDLERHFIGDWDRAARILARAVDALAQEGAAVPACAMENLKRRGWLPADFRPTSEPERPGVLGLVAVPGAHLGYVLPLNARDSPAGWQIDETLPFRAEAVLSTLVKLAQASGLPTTAVLPERLAFSFTNPLDYRAVGNSMTIAAVLAILDALDGCRSRVLRCACAVVEPGPDGQLQAVRHIGPKLEAVRREFERGSLLICVPGCPEAAAFRHHFDQVWQVADFAALTRALDQEGLLEPLLRRAPLRRQEVERIYDRLRWLVEQAKDYAQASDLGRRFGDPTTAEPIPARLLNAIRGLVAESWRHQGRFQEANSASRRIYEQVQAQADGMFTSYDERADAAAEYASALFDAHCFADMPSLLKRWLQEMERNPQQLRPETRVKVLNTLGRARVILGEEGWAGLFRRSLELQERLDPGAVPRTKCYLIHGLLRHGLLTEARAEFETLGPFPGIHDFSGRVLRFLYADLERRAGRCWVDGEMDKLTVGGARPGHPAAFYFQATARQPGQPDAARRLHLATDFLRDDGRNHPQNITSLFADCLELSAAVAVGDHALWARAADGIRRFLDDPEAATLRAYYEPALTRLTDDPDAEAAEHFLRLVPYF